MPKHQRDEHPGELLTGEELLAPDTSPTTAVADFQSALGQAINEIAEASPEVARQVARKESKRFYWVAVAASIVISVCGIGYSYYTNSQLGSTNEQLDKVNSILKSQGKPQVPLPATAAEANQRLIQAEVRAQLPKWAVPTPGAAGAPGAQGVPGEPGTPGQSITGPAGPAGQPGQSVTGPQGPPGSPGQSVTGPQGPTGPAGQSVTGPTGPQGPAGPAGESVTGPAGPEGPQGETGPPGRGVSNIAFQQSGSGCNAVITYTDGTSDQVPVASGVCSNASGGSSDPTESPSARLGRGAGSTATATPTPTPTTTPTPTGPGSARQQRSETPSLGRNGLRVVPNLRIGP